MSTSGQIPLLQHEIDSERLHKEVETTQAELAATIDELVQTQARIVVAEADIAARRSKVVQMQIDAILRKDPFV